MAEKIEFEASGFVSLKAQIREANLAYQALLADVNATPAAINAATFFSSSTFQSMKVSISGWSRSRQTILAARRVVPPLLMAPAARSPILRKLIRPEDVPPPLSFSPSPRMLEKLVPTPEPYLKILASRTQRSMIPPSFTKSSSTLRMKQAWGCGRS